MAQPLDWSPDQARDLLEQGYPVDRVAAMTGYDARWVAAQQRLRERAAGRATRD